MSPLPRYVLRNALLVLSGFALVAAAPAPVARKATAKPPVTAKADDGLPWLYKGSDIPVDTSWTFGKLPNGARYAVRSGRVPPGQVSIRVAIDAGSLMEEESERGFAHFMEHLSFRGSRHVPDGEAKRVWQRMGATFGSDSNAATTPTQTIYKLDLPSASPATLDESLKILAGMMAEPSLTSASVDAERRTLLAEMRESVGPQLRVAEAMSDLMYHGQRLSKRMPIGTTEALNGATAASLKAFHTRWYRPEKLIISISGDGERSVFEELIKKHFSDWKVPGAPAPDPDFGRPDPKGPTADVIVEPGLPGSITLAYVRPWTQKDDTVVYNQGKQRELIATRLINRRLETRARAGGSFLQAQVSRDDVSRSTNGTFVSIIPINGDWEAALKDVREVIADALANPPLQADIDREMGEFLTALDVEVESAKAEPSAQQADSIIEAVNIRETVATAEVARDVFKGLVGKVSPQGIVQITRDLFTGVGPRAFLSSPTEVAGGEATLTAALNAPVTARGATSQAAIGFDRLPKLPGTSKIVQTTARQDFGLRMLRLSNGVTVMLKPNRGEAGRVYVSARFGNGMQAFPKNKATPSWASSALIAAGIGDLGQEEMDRMTTGRRIGISFDVADDAFFLRGVTRPADLKDQLALMAAKLHAPRWDANPVQRTKAAAVLGLETARSSPQAVLERDLNGILRGGDKRWATPAKADIEALTPEAFQKFWEPLLKKGPIELSIFGDFDLATVQPAILASFGALPSRGGKTGTAGAGPAGPKPNTLPQMLTHTGPADQAAALLSWETGGGMQGFYTSRKLDVLAAIFADRMFERLREAEGGSYSPNVFSNWPNGMKRGGNFVVLAQIKPEGADRFFALSREIAADLAAKPVSEDELLRALGPMREQLQRAASGNGFWLSQLAGAMQDKRKFDALEAYPIDLLRITTAELQAMAKQFLLPGKSFSLLVMPEKK